MKGKMQQLKPTTKNNKNSMFVRNTPTATQSRTLTSPNSSQDTPSSVETTPDNVSIPSFKVYHDIENYEKHPDNEDQLTLRFNNYVERNDKLISGLMEGNRQQNQDILNAINNLTEKFSSEIRMVKDQVETVEQKATKEVSNFNQKLQTLKDENNKDLQELKIDNGFIKRENEDDTDAIKKELDFFRTYFNRIQNLEDSMNDMRSDISKTNIKVNATDSLPKDRSK